MSRRCEIPIPPSANRLWRIFGNRVHKSSHYKQWLEEATWTLKRSLTVCEPPHGVIIEVYSGKGFTVRRDLDNCAKPVLDALRDSGVIADDSVQHVTSIELAYYDVGKKNPATCFVEVIGHRTDSAAEWEGQE